MLRKIADWFWPTLAPLPAEYLPALQARVAREIAAQDMACAKDPEAAASWLQHELDDFKEEQARMERTRATLRAMLGAGTIAITATLALAGWLAARLTGKANNERAPTDVSFALFMLVGLYIVLQLVVIVRCTIKGLRVRDFETIPHPIREPGEADEAFDRRKASEVRNASTFNSEQTNDAVSWKMAVFVGWRNLVVGVVVLLLGILVSVAANTNLVGASRLVPSHVAAVVVVVGVAAPHRRRGGRCCSSISLR